MIIVRFKGGFGNQLFQYAAGMALAERHGTPLLFDHRWFGSAAAQGTTARSFDLMHFAVRGRLASPIELSSFFHPATTRRPFRLPQRLLRRLCGRHLWCYDGMAYESQFNALPPHTLIDGYFQHPAYFEKVASLVRIQFRLRDDPPLEIRERSAQLAASPSVCIQVRRSDFAENPIMARTHGVCSLDYFRNAWCQMRAIAPGAQGVVFPDDPAWAHDAFSGWPAISIVGPEWNGPQYMYQFQLMRSCRHFIIANSTWGWWAAWLGEAPDKVVVMPERWFRDDNLNAMAAGLRVPSWIICGES